MNLLPNQYNCIGIVAKHCDLSKLCIAENEASNFDLAELFCDFWIEIEQINDEVLAYQADPELPIPDNYDEKLALLNGGTYLDCSQKQRPFEGIYKILTYYSYSRYIVLNGFSDTPNGLVQKTNEFSIPKSLKELEQFSDKYRNMGKISFERTVRYICQNTEIFDYSHCPVDKCGCGSGKCGSTKAKGYGFKSRNVTK
jgi:hypothetical protein